jgi:Zn-dependent protease
VNEVGAGNPLWAAATLILPLVLAIVCHEVSHGAVARLLGDRTAAEQGRLTLNPIAHVDWFGTVILPGMLALAHLPVFGWAKPVPVDFRRLRNPRLGMMLVAAAGPLSNLLLAAAAAVGIGAIAGSLTGKLAEFGFASFCLDNLRNFLAVNLFLALFNLLPVPPFDGSHIVEGALPRRAAIAYAGMRRYALPIMLILLVIVPRLWPSANIIDAWVGPPFEWLAGHYLALAQAVAGLFRG